MGDAAQFEYALPEDVAVETFTVIAYSDGRPTEAVYASTDSPVVRHVRLNSIGSTAINQCLRAVVTVGTDEVISDG